MSSTPIFTSCVHAQETAFPKNVRADRCYSQFAFLTVVLEVKQFTSFIRQLDLESFTSLLPQPLASPAQPLVAESRRNLPARETGQQLARSFKMITRNTRQAKEVEGQPLVAQGKLGWQQRLIHRQLHTSRPRIDANLQRVFSLARSGSWSKPFGSKSPSSIDGPQSRRFNAALDSFSSPVRTNVHGVVPTPSTYTNHTIHQPSAGPFSIVCAQNRDQQVKAGTTSSIIKPINVNQNPSAGPGKAL